ncbi:hypothetical protein E5K41_01615 [Helicobacter pylori]|nr:hypothetical protein E5K41_01615 [Helicobacter pylori]
MIVDSEGFSLSIYTDKTGHPTISYGYNLSVYSYESRRITKAYGLLTDILKKNHRALLSYEWYKNLDAMRRMVILDLSYNLGLSGLLKFKQFIKGHRGDRRERDLNLKMGFVAAIGAMAGVSGLAIAAKLTPKLVAKIGAKLGAKVGSKFLAKIGTAVSGSWTCGPFAPSCAIGLWFGSDAVINFIDEWIHRDDFKKEILNNINEVKENLKNSYKQQFNDSFVKISQEFQESYKNAPVVEKKTIKEHIDDLNQTPEEDNQKNNQ